ncbi:hypothetical protein LQ327_06320 [Actinomycetospora endophytica]|uniref:Uncharacterized protein n=1 Tax=Actinomycetospora endophytica TaxID=2291215 RepID=A0ABS8P4P9_9PSEU|nr:hypothetical protein [Actinomycetospora endophytica]MCD2193003.1 hypothetical protein [Actinomycetospora endophytica]
MEAEVASALWQVEAAFVAHQARDVLESLTPRQSPVVVAEADPLALALGLGETIGAPDDVRALTPWLLRAVVTDDRVDLRSVLSRIAAFWHRWTTSERAAVRDFVDTLWVALLDRHPGPVAVLPVATAASFLDDASGLGDGVGRLLGIWEYKDTASADHHLAELIIDAHYGARVDPEVLDWARDRPQRERLERAAARDHAEPWAGDLGAALDLLATPPD